MQKSLSLLKQVTVEFADKDCGFNSSWVTHAKKKHPGPTLLTQPNPLMWNKELKGPAHWAQKKVGEKNYF